MEPTAGKGEFLPGHPLPPTGKRRCIPAAPRGTVRGIRRCPEGRGRRQPPWRGLGAGCPGHTAGGGPRSPGSCAGGRRPQAPVPTFAHHSPEAHRLLSPQWCFLPVILNLKYLLVLRIWTCVSTETRHVDPSHSAPDVSERDRVTQGKSELHSGLSFPRQLVHDKRCRVADR